MRCRSRVLCVNTPNSCHEVGVEFPGVAAHVGHNALNKTFPTQINLSIKRIKTFRCRLLQIIGLLPLDAVIVLFDCDIAYIFSSSLYSVAK